METEDTGHREEDIDIDGVRDSSRTNPLRTRIVHKVLIFSGHSMY